MTESELLPPEELERRLRAIGEERYHIHHPFHHLLHGGKLTRPQVQAWALNRYYYQASIPAKDAAVLGRLPTPELRREWRRRIVDHDGDGEKPGGVERWLILTDGLGLDRDYVTSLRGLLPGTRHAVDAYVNFVKSRSVLEAVASSLTEMFSPDIISQRVSGMLRNYDFVSERTLAYFTPRLTQAPQDVEFALGYVKAHARTRAEQEQVMDALRFKCDLLWAQLDALHFAYVEPGYVPPGAWRPDGAALTSAVGVP
ncbi:pyrroloquinoline-quinone synthase PqqC [Paracraurococcus ruber]|uniref:Pyrroloquinoline-quinone synthase n=1 Tax=Paracraurococcus ruber TaxID=77675 RepID=A0ABS1CRG7_9PROT|nr:pyrroloquinoline-quinone synthase PqqC [Paracraurococcus ruber]MBK1657038.1 pyrroloquinoline quinone biosynthesis protein C [Paracraurococcus ruber]TDG32521.1 pyrroloquinoline quinone biosynthesis protein PqqC [Paracraurococcus ruber]